jgi:hypothetical protein
MSESIPERDQTVFDNLTTTERDSLTPQTGGVIFNTTTSKMEYYNGSNWIEM